MRSSRNQTPRAQLLARVSTLGIGESDFIDATPQACNPLIARLILSFIRNPICYLVMTTAGLTANVEFDRRRNFLTVARASARAPAIFPSYNTSLRAMTDDTSGGESL